MLDLLIRLALISLVVPEALRPAEFPAEAVTQVTVLALGQIDPPETAARPPDAPEPGVIGAEGRVPVALFRPPDPESMPGWDQALRSVVQIDCIQGGGGLGTGVLIGAGDQVLTAAHLFLNQEGRQVVSPARCRVWLDDPAAQVRLWPRSLRVGNWSVPPALAGRFAVDVSRHDWAIVTLTRPLPGTSALRLASAEDPPPVAGQAILLVSGPNDSHPHDGRLAQVCRYLGPPPVSAALTGDGEIIERLAQPQDALTVGRTDCDVGQGSSGSPFILWTPRGQGVVWGILTDSMRGRWVCPYPGRSTCFSAGPLAPVIGVEDGRP